MLLRVLASEGRRTPLQRALPVFFIKLPTMRKPKSLSGLGILVLRFPACEDAQTVGPFLPRRYSAFLLVFVWF